MRILYFISGVGPPAGWGTEYVQDLIFNLADKGVKVTLINPIYIHTPSRWREWVSEKNNHPNIEIIPLEFPVWIRSNLMLNFFMTPFFVTFSAFRLLRKQKFDCVHEFSSTPIILFRSFLFRLFFNLPSVFTLSVYNSSFLGSFIWFRIFDFAKYYLVPSKIIASQLENLHIKRDKIIYSLPGLDLGKFASKKQTKATSRSKLGISRNKYIFTFFGSLTREKGIEDIINSLKYLDKQLLSRISIYLFTIWKGSTEHNTLRDKLKNIEHIHLIEKYVDIPTLLFASDVILLPQQTGMGTTIPPISVVESLAANKKIITTPINSNTELSIYGEIIFVPPNNPEKISEAIKKVCQENTNGSIHRLKYENIVNAFSIDQSVNRHLYIYQRLIPK